MKLSGINILIKNYLNFGDLKLGGASPDQYKCLLVLLLYCGACPAANYR
jgi:hypothetical protein